MKTQCSKSWTDVNIDFKNKLLRHCCKAEPYNFPDKLSIDFFDNSPQIQERRRHTTHGIQHPDCNSCWRDINSGNAAYKDWMNEWNTNDFDTKNLKNPHTKYIEVELDNTCDQSCLYCASVCSSKIAKEEGVVNIDNTQQQDIEVFKQWINQLVMHHGHRWLSILFTGGEPTASKLFYELIDYLHDIAQQYPNFNITIELCTNGNSKPHLMDKLIKAMDKKIAKWHVAISNESYGEDSELIRYGLNWDRFTSNVERYMKHPSVEHVVFSTTINSLSLPSFATYLKFIQSMIIGPTLNKDRWVGGHVTSPWELDIKHAPTHYKEYLIAAKKQHESYIINDDIKRRDREYILANDKFYIFLDSMEKRVGSDPLEDWEEIITAFLKNKNKVKKTKKLNKLIDDIKVLNSGK